MMKPWNVDLKTYTEWIGQINNFYRIWAWSEIKGGFVLFIIIIIKCVNH